MSLPAYGDTVNAYGEVVLVYGRTSPVGIEVNERDDVMPAAVFIDRHGIMCRVQEQLFDFSLRKELLHGEPVIKEADGIMPGSGPQEREDREVAFRIRGREHVQVIAEIPAFPVGIPSDVAVGLAVDTVTAAVPDAVFEAVAGTLLTFPGGSVDGGAVPGKGEAAQVDQPALDERE